MKNGKTQKLPDKSQPFAVNYLHGMGMKVMDPFTAL